MECMFISMPCFVPYQSPLLLSVSVPMGQPILPIRQIYSINSTICLFLGGLLNLTVIWLVLNKTPKEMKVYSKIVLQTSFCDLALLATSMLVQPILFVSNGVAIILENGICTWLPHPWNVLLYNCWFLNSYFVSVGIVVQFIYRYLTLCRNVEIKTGAYFAMLIAAAGAEAFLLSFFFWIGHPPLGARVEDEQVLRILGERSDQGQGQPVPWPMRPVLYGDKKSLPWLIWLGFFLLFSLLCYGTIWFCGRQMIRYVRQNLKMSGTSARVLEVNRQMTRNMVIQASIPVLDILVFLLAAYASVAESKGDWFVCLCMLLGPIVNWIPVLNPLVTILTVTPYRKCLIRVGPSLPSGSTVHVQAASKVFRRVSHFSSDSQRRREERQRDSDKTGDITPRF